jgi:rubrerythrin
VSGLPEWEPEITPDRRRDEQARQDATIAALADAMDRACDWLCDRCDEGFVYADNGDEMACPDCGEFREIARRAKGEAK